MTHTKKQKMHRIISRVNGLLDVKNDKSRKAITLFALGVFVVGLTVAAQHLDTAIVWHVSGALLVSMVGLLALTFLINTLRTHTHSRVVGARLSFEENAKISLFGSAMNMLPLIIPAGMVLRMSNFVQHGGDSGLVTRVFVVNYLLALLSSLLLGIGMLSTTGLEHLQEALLLIGGLYIATLLGLVRLSGIKFGLSIGALELLAVVVTVRAYKR